MDAYSPAVARRMKRLYLSLRDNDRRRSAAIEAKKRGHGGIKTIARLLGCDPQTVRQGIAELEAEDELDPERVRKTGWTKTRDRHARQGIRDFLESAARSYGRRSHEPRGQVDPPVTPTNPVSDDEPGHAGQPSDGEPVVATPWIPSTPGDQERHDGESSGSQCSVDSIATWWEQQGCQRYLGAKKLLLLCDGGGSNRVTQYLFKEDLQKLSNRLGLEIRVAHYPPYCSKYNPMEHRLFAQMSRACRGVIVHTLETAKHYMSKTETTTGLKVIVGVLETVSATGRKYMTDFKEPMKIVFDKVLPKWNYTAKPESA